MPTRRTLLATAGLPLAAAARPRSESWRELLELASVPGAAIGRIEKGRLAWTEYLGVRHGVEKTPITSRTLFAAASLTKPLAAWVALQLAGEGTLDLDRPIHDQLPFAQNDRARRVTTRHVLSHSTGFPNWRFRTEQQLECAFEPGSAFGYSGEGFYLLQQLLEKTSGMSFSQLMRDRALQPLGMTASALDRSEVAQSELATPHTRRGEVRPTNAPPANTPPLPVNRSPNAAASLLTTLPDYANFAILAMRRSDWFEPRTKVTRHISWGLGWGLEEFRGERWCWHWGDNPGFKNLILCRPARQDGLVVFTNGDNGQAVYERIVPAVLGHDHPILLWI